MGFLLIMEGTYKGSVAVTDSEDIYVSSNYAYNYYSFNNYQDAVYYFESGSSSGTATTTIGPAPTYLAALSSPAMDLSEAVGFKMSFKISYNFYFEYEGAYMEVSTDGELTTGIMSIMTSYRARSTMEQPIQHGAIH